MTLFFGAYKMKATQNKSVDNHIKKETLNPLEVHLEFGISVSTLSKWRMINKNLPFIKLGRAVKYKRSDIEAFLDANTVEVA